MRLTHNCPTCNIPVKTIIQEFPLGNLMNYVYQCGHVEVRTPFILTNEPEKVKEEAPKVPEWAWAFGTCKPYDCKECNTIHDRKHAYSYQREGVAFLANSNLNGLIADEMGLGKTIQAALTLRRFASELTPALIVVKGATQLQWLNELREWAFNGIAEVMPIVNRASFIPGLKAYIISMDLLSKKDIQEKIKSLGIRSMVLDECQNYKDSSSKRTISLIKILEENNINHKIPLSGTPIKNRADEYFTILNLLNPSRFSSYKYFCSQYLQMEYDTKTGKPKGYTKLNPYMKDAFERNTKDLIIRREVKDVMQDLPSLRVSFQLCEIDDPGLRQSYNYQIDLFRNWLENKSQVTAAGMLGWLAKLRAITGQAKCKMAVDYVDDFITTVEDQKIAIGIHHQSVRDTLSLVFKARGYDPLVLSGDDDGFEKGRIAARINSDPTKRVLVISQRAGGEGLNLQGISNFVSLERMWTGTDEDQFIKRFHRNGQTRPVHGVYFIAQNTIDEFFHELVWKKRNRLATVGLDNEVDETESVEFLREFSEIVVNHKLI